MELKNITSAFQKLFTRMKRGYAGDVAPERDWFLLLGIACVLLLVSATTNAISFVRVYEGDPISATTDTAPNVRETEELAARLESVEILFDVRATSFEAAIENSYPFVDPARN